MPCKLPHYNCSISFYASIISQKFSGASLPNPHHGLHPWLSLGAAPQTPAAACSTVLRTTSLASFLTLPACFARHTDLTAITYLA